MARVLFRRGSCDDAGRRRSGRSGKAFEIKRQVARRLETLQWFFFETPTDDSLEPRPNGLAGGGNMVFRGKFVNVGVLDYSSPSVYSVSCNSYT